SYIHSPSYVSHCCFLSTHLATSVIYPLSLHDALPIFSKDIFEDIEQFLKLKEIINNQTQELSFSDPLLLDFVQQLNCIKDSLFIKDPPPKPTQDSLLEQVKIIRWEKMIRSYITLAIITIHEALLIESPL